MSKGSLNKVMLIGNLGTDPEVRYMPNGNAVATISLATSETWKDKETGEQREKTEWHRVVFFGRLAEIVGQYLRKGSKIYVEGRLQTRKWQGQDGQDRYTTEVVVDLRGEMMMLDRRSAPAETTAPLTTPDPVPRTQTASPSGKAQTTPEKPQTPDPDDDIPF